MYLDDEYDPTVVYYSTDNKGRDKRLKGTEEEIRHQLKLIRARQRWQHSLRKGKIILESTLGENKIWVDGVLKAWCPNNELVDRFKNNEKIGLFRLILGI